MHSALHLRSRDLGDYKASILNQNICTVFDLVKSMKIYSNRLGYQTPGLRCSAIDPLSNDLHFINRIWERRVLASFT